MLDHRKFDWETINDAETLQRYQNIVADPGRLQKAKDCIKDEVAASNAALGIQTPPPVPGRKNPATIMKLNVDKK